MGPRIVYVEATGPNATQEYWKHVAKNYTFPMPPSALAV